jgi:hypothetical protein
MFYRIMEHRQKHPVSADYYNNRAKAATKTSAAGRFAPSLGHADRESREGVLTSDLLAPFEDDLGEIFDLEL